LWDGILYEYDVAFRLKSVRFFLVQQSNLLDEILNHVVTTLVVGRGATDNFVSQIQIIATT